MSNKVLNASGLDGVTDWTGATSVDETTIGAPGRVVLVSSSGSLRSTTTPVEPGAVIEAAGAYQATGGGAVLEVEFLDVSLAVIETTAVPVKRYPSGSPRRGIASTFALARGRLLVPVGAATARLRARGTGTVYLLRPWMETVLYGEFGSTWQTGQHSNPDLALSSWPTKLPPLDEGGYSVDPIPRRKSFAGDAGVPMTRELSSTPRYMLRGSLRLDAEEQDRLEDFFALADSPFWFTRQDNLQLCRAYWTADGELAFAGLVRGRRRVTFTLLLEVA